MKIDIVILWVDPNDKQWQESKRKYEMQQSGEFEIDYSTKRYRDFDNLQYVFRGIDKYMPWVNKVFFVTCGQKPVWLNEKCEKLVLVDHKDFMPKEYLPTFNCNPIEINLHRIKDLSEHFIYFNDDMFILKKMEEEDFFKNGLPCETAVLNPVTPSYDNIVTKIWFNDWAIINKHINKKESIHNNFFKWFNFRYGKEVIRTIMLNQWNNFLGFKFTHLPTSMLKSTYEELWNIEGKELDEVSKNKFRSEKDLSQYLMKDWQLAKGQFYPRSPKIGTVINVDDENVKKAASIIRNRKYKMICINDTDDIKNFEDVKNDINREFEKILPSKSIFEV